MRGAEPEEEEEDEEEGEGEGEKEEDDEEDDDDDGAEAATGTTTPRVRSACRRGYRGRVTVASGRRSDAAHAEPSVVSMLSCVWFADWCVGRRCWCYALATKGNLPQ